MKENSPKLGHLITDEVKRDAIHFAVAPVTVHGMHPLKPGDFVKFAIFGNTEMVRACTPEDAIGIVDPFLCVKVKPGQHCWMMLMPNTITGLRHEWTHPAFEYEQRGVSEWWLREFADKQSIPYESMMGQLIESNGRSVYSGHDLDYTELGDKNMAVFWKHVQIVTGKDMEGRHAEGGQPFNCAC